MKLSKVDQLTKKIPYITLDQRKTAFMFMEDNTFEVVDHLTLKPFNISTIVEPIKDDKARKIDFDPEKSTLTSSEDFTIINTRKLPLLLNRNKPFAFNLNTFLSIFNVPSWKNVKIISRIGSYVSKITKLIQDNDFKVVLVYSINLGSKQPMNVLQSRIYPILKLLEDNELKVDSFLLHVLTKRNNSSCYQLHTGDMEFQRSKVYTIINKFLKKSKDLDDLDQFIDTHKNKLDAKTIEAIKDEPEAISIIASEGPIEKKLQAFKIMAQLDDEERSEFVDEMIDSNLNDEALGKYTNQIKEFTLDFQEDPLPVNENKSEMSALSIQVSKTVNSNVDMTQLKQKRKMEIEQFFLNDVKKVLSHVGSDDEKYKIEITDIEIKESGVQNDIRRTVMDDLVIKYKNYTGKRNTLKIKIPRLIEDSYFVHYGQKKALMFQIIPDIITKPKPDQVRIVTHYSTASIEKKGKEPKSFYEIYTGGQRLPAAVLLAYWYGLENLLKELDISFIVHAEKEKPDDIEFNGRWYSIKTTNNINRNMIYGLRKYLEKAKKIDFDVDITDDQFLERAIIEIQGSSRIPYIMRSIHSNFIDPISKEIAEKKNIPTEITRLFIYGINYLEKAKVTRSTDLTKKRLRYSEIMVQSIDKIMSAAYNEYRSNASLGNEDAKLFVNPNIIMKDLNESTLLNVVENTNPIEEIQTLTRVKPTGPSGIPDSGSIPLSSRNLDETYFGIIDPVDTPESDSIGVSQQLAVSQDLSSARGLFPKYTSKNKNTIFGVGTGMTPYARFDDQNRLQMAANQIRQAIPLKNPATPLIQTGYESIVSPMLSESFIKKSDMDGTVTNITEKNIEVTDKEGKKKLFSIESVKLHSGTGKSSGSVFKPTVSVGDKVKKNQILAEGACVKDGILSLGKPLLSAIMIYDGFTFEDSVLISERLVKDEVLTSVHVLEYEMFVNKDNKIDYIAKIGEKLTEGAEIVKIEKTPELGFGEDEDLLSEYDDNDNGDLDIQEDVRYKSYLAPKCEVLDINIVANTPVEGEYKKYVKGRIGKNLYKGGSFEGALITIKVKQELPIMKGDKMCNRHGNKGIISTILPVDKMPKWRGQPIDIIYSPMSIIGRMNIGQLYELYLGLCLKELKKIVIDNGEQKKINSLKLIESFYTILDNTPNKKLSETYIAGYRNIFKHKFKDFINELNGESDFTLIVPHFEEPDLKAIRRAMALLGLKQSYKVELPDFESETDNEVAVGYQTWYKLEHLSENKIHARSTGPTSKTLQGVAGKKRGGAAKLGEGDVSNLIDYGVWDFLREAFTTLSDDHTKKNNMINNIIKNGEAHIDRESKSSPTKQILDAYMHGMQLQVNGLDTIQDLYPKSDGNNLDDNTI